MDPNERPATPPLTDDGWWFDEPSGAEITADPSAPATAGGEPSGRSRSAKTWVMAGVGAAAIALASVVGINYASSHISSAATAATGQGGQGGQGQFPGGPGGLGGPQGAMGTSGAIASIDGTTLTLTTQSGTAKVTTSSSTTVTKSVAGSLRDVAVGDTIMVRGTSSGTDAVTATAITDQGEAASASGGGLAPGTPPGGQSGGPSGAPPSGQSGGPPGAAPGGATGPGGTVGTVTAIDGSTITITSMMGGTEVTITTTAATTVSIAQTSSLSALTTGEQVRVIGSTDSDGTVVATRIIEGEGGAGVFGGG